MDALRIAALLQPFLASPLHSSQLDQISIYIDRLLLWNARINLSAIRHPEQIVTRHFGESFFLARHLFPLLSTPRHPDQSCHPERSEGPAFSPPSYPSPPRVLDIGSGAGFPALPLKIWAPHIHLTLIESNHKKAVFLQEVARALTLTNINVISERAETLATHLGPNADIVTLRAVEHFHTILPQALRFMAPQSALALLIGSAQTAQLTTLTPLQWYPPIPVPQSHQRVLSIGVHQ